MFAERIFVARGPLRAAALMVFRVCSALVVLSLYLRTRRSEAPSCRRGHWLVFTNRPSPLQPECRMDVAVYTRTRG